MFKRPFVGALTLAAWCFTCASVPAADWLTFAHDPQRSGWAFEEEALTLENVSGLELKWKAELKNEPRSLTALTAPLVVSDVPTIKGVKTVVYVAGSSNNFFAVDASDGTLIWNRTLETRVLPKDPGMWLCPNGVNATPTFDKRRGMIYMIAADGQLYGLDSGSGVTRFGPISFVPPYSKNWSLNLFEDRVYTSISQGCGGARSGIYSINVDDEFHPLVREVLVSRDGGGGIWGRGGPVVGTNGRVYATTGDGNFDPAEHDFSSTVIAASLPDLKIVDYYAPINWRDVTRYDWDISSSSPVWFSHKDYNLLVAGGKEGVAYLIDADSLGEKDHRTPLYISPRLANDENTFEANGIWGAPSAWRDSEDRTWFYIPIWGATSKHAPQFPVGNGPHPHGCLMAFQVALEKNTRKPYLAPAWISSDINLPDPPVIANGIVFILGTGENPKQTRLGGIISTSNLQILSDKERESSAHAILYALDAKTGKVLYQSGTAIDTWTHFSGLAVANGRIYAVDHGSKLYCFGLK